ncbi:hypothetical protein [Jiangella rhizosphaerae]|uniref:hypothetical protein n=1 Tax=Jiangella rhizosphaerae TaxID=2293569 RepID=UPI0011C3A86B|nr:hypothetical protein [Jiangella rhizosphaerae]
MSYSIIPGKDRALCCQCGTVRTCTPKHNRLRNLQGERMQTPEEIAAMKARTEARKGREYAQKVWGRARPWERMTCDLKCATCGTVTRHAVLRDHAKPEWRNQAENSVHGHTRASARGGDMSAAEMRAALERMLENLDKDEEGTRSARTPGGGKPRRRRRPRHRRLTRP